MLFPVQTQPSLPYEGVVLLYVFRMQLVHKHSLSTENVLKVAPQHFYTILNLWCFFLRSYYSPFYFQHNQKSFE